MRKKSEVLLLKPLPPRGNAGDVIDVKIHYANMVLIPQGIAIWHDQQAKNQRESQMKKIEKNKAEYLSSVKDMLAAIEANGGLIFDKQATEAGKLYDSISAKDIANKIHMDYKIKLAVDHFENEKIEELGEYSSMFTYESITSKIPVKVVKKGE